MASNVIQLSQIVRLEKPRESGTWGGVSSRARVGKSANSNLYGGVSSSRFHGSDASGATNRILTDEDLWEVYLRCPDVRAPIDAISRRISTWDWSFEPTVDPASEEYESAEMDAKEATEFFEVPNEDGEPIQVLLDQFTKDLLIFDHGVWELVFDTKFELDEKGLPKDRKAPIVGDELKEVVALRGSDIFPVKNSYGRLMGYDQRQVVGSSPSYVIGNGIEGAGKAEDVEGSEIETTFSKKQILAQNLSSNTSQERTPIIETIIVEITAICLASQHSARSFSSEVPPGILVLAGIAGLAAEDAKRDLKQMKGRDDELRVITVTDPGSKGAHWVQLNHTSKDVDKVNVTKGIQRAIWRAFGVLPIEMGASEDIPRAVGAVQLEVSTSHLINPILEVLEQRINAKLLHLLPGGQHGRIKFRFDRETKLTPAEQKVRAETVTGLVKEGIITRNEARQELSKAPLGDAGDIATVTTSQGPVPLDVLVLSPGGGEDDDDPDDGPSGGEATVQNPELEADSEEVDRAFTRDSLPSSWPEASRFKDVRTINLDKLGDLTEQYSKQVDPLYWDAEAEVSGAFQSIYREGSFREEEAAQLQRRVNSIITKLEVQWSTTTDSIYRKVAKVARDAATDMSGQPVIDNWASRADSYHGSAMSYLTTDGGLTDTLRTKMFDLIEAALIANRDVGQRGKIVELSDTSSETLLKRVLGAWTASSHRIKNWSGRLVDLANNVLVDGMQEASTTTDSEDGGLGTTEWFVEWVAVGDKGTCATCERESLRGFVRASSLAVSPGGATECQARCRCVLTWWTRAEVQSGAATSLN